MDYSALAAALKPYILQWDRLPPGAPPIGQLNVVYNGTGWAASVEQTGSGGILRLTREGATMFRVANNGDTIIAGTLTLGTLSGVLKASTGLITGGATTSDLPEGTNLYYTDARARAAVSAAANLGLTYSSSTGVFTLVQDIRTSATPQFAGINIGGANGASAGQVRATGDIVARYGTSGATIGDVGFGSSYAGFAHASAFTTTNYALLGQSDGSTFLNAASANLIHFRIANVEVMTMSGSDLLLAGANYVHWRDASTGLFSPATTVMSPQASNSIQSTTFISGFEGQGWGVYANGRAEFQDAYIRGTLYATTFTYKEVNALNGYFMVTNVSPLAEDTLADYPYSATIIQDAPVGYWRLGEAVTTTGSTAADSSGNGRNGIYINSITGGVAGGQTSDSDTAATFHSASADHVDVADHATLRGFTTLSFEFWAKLSDLAANRAVFGKVDYYVVALATSGAIRVALNTTAGLITHDFTAVLSTSAWKHVLFTFDGTDWKLYINGVLDQTITDARTLSMANTALLKLGQRAAGTDPFNGSLDEIAIYATALSAARVAQHYRVSVPLWLDVEEPVFRGDATRGDSVIKLQVLDTMPTSGGGPAVLRNEYVRVTSYSGTVTAGDGRTAYRYLVTRGFGGTTPQVWPKKTPVVEWGRITHSGGGTPNRGGWVTMVGGSTDQDGPYVRVQRRTGDTFSDYKTLVHFGNLSGVLGLTASDYGFAVGDDLTAGAAVTGRWFAFDPTNGLRLNNVTLSLYNSSLNTVYMQPNGQSVWGSNVAAAATTAFGIFPVATTYNGESLAAGSVLFGVNSSTYSNVLWDPAAKQLKFRGGTTTQAYIDTDGSFVAGGAKLNSSGVTFTPGDSVYTTVVSWNVAGDTAPVFLIEALRNAGSPTLDAARIGHYYHNSSTLRAYIFFQENLQLGANQGGGVASTLDVYPAFITLSTPTASVTGGLNVGSATGAAAGEIALSGPLRWKGTTGTSIYGEFSLSGTAKAYVGLSGAANGLINGSTAGDLILRTQGDDILFSTDSGTNIALSVAAANGATNVKNGLNVGIATGAATGEVRASARGYFGDAIGWVIHRTLTILTNGVAQILDSANGYAFIFMHEVNLTGASAIYALAGGLSLTYEVFDSAAIYTPTAGTANSINIYWSAGNARFEVENKRASTIILETWELQGQ